MSAAPTEAPTANTSTHGYPQQLLRLPVVMARTGKSRSSIYEDPNFPKPVKIGPRCVAWPSSEIDAWVMDRIAARDAEVAA
jgi:prophage regulatory protein